VLWHWKADWNEDPKRRTPVEVVKATGPKNPLVAMAEDSQTVLGKGVYQEGQWKLVIVRPLTAKGRDISFLVGEPIPIAFFAWDGSNGEQGLMMSLSSWFYLILEAPIPLTVYLFTLLGILGGFGAELSLVRWARNRSAAVAREPLATPAGASD
ncbi:MAG: hypothetical protein HYV04_00220, partial [Deltaproteobacteria bacterium]|nr:hypothetical protein [Deltaproteobacteria bacterium]